MKKITHLFFTVLLTMPFLHAQVSMVKNVGPNVTGNVDHTQSISFDGKLIFRTNELWISDGSETGTYMLADLNPSSSSYPEGFYYSSILNKVFFYARINGASNKLFALDNTLSITNVTGSNDYGITAHSLKGFVDYNNKVYFRGYIPATLNEVEMYSTDGTASGLALVEDVFPNSSSDPDNLTLYAGMIIFSAKTSSQTGVELCSYNTTNQTTLIKNINTTNFQGSLPSDFLVFNNKVYFTADDGINGRELWVTDGTETGTQLVSDLYVGTSGSNPENLTVFNNALYFTATHPTLGTELFKMATTQNITLLKNIAAGSGNSNPTNLFVSNGKLYFSADDNTNGRELWSSTGFSSTTNMLKDINTSAASPDSNPSGFVEYFGELYFAANDGVTGRELWKTNGTNAGTSLVSDINTSGDSNPTGFAVVNNFLLFFANNATSLWKYQDPSLTTDSFQLENNVSLYPNPTKESFSVNGIDIPFSISITDIQGKLIKTFTNQLENYDISDLNAGIYFARIKSKKGKVTKKIIKL